MVEHTLDSTMSASIHPKSPVQTEAQSDHAPASAGRKRSLEDACENDAAVEQQNASESCGNASPAQKKIRLSDPEVGEAKHQTEDALLASPSPPDPESIEKFKMDVGGGDEYDDDDGGEDEEGDDEEGNEEGEVEEPTHNNNDDDDDSDDDDDDDYNDENDDKEENDDADKEGGAPATGPRDWNSASHKVIRTSFGASLPPLNKSQTNALGRLTTSSITAKSTKDAGTTADVQVEPWNERAGVESATATQSKSISKFKSKSRSKSGSEAPDHSTLRRKSVDWHLPELQLDLKGGRKKQFLVWCQQFCSDNISNIAKADARLLRRGYLVCLEAASVAEQVRKECKKGARNTESSQVDKIISGFVAQDEISSELSEGEIMSGSEEATGKDEQRSNTPGKQAQKPPGPGGSGKVQLSREEELQQLHLYFPHASQTNFCVLCARKGHRANDCPLPRCRHCQTQGHTPAQCPTRVRCTKCHRLGHIKRSCPEKLASAPGEEEYECAVCCATDHLENSCDSLWCTYYPDLENIVKVQSIPAFCYSCGADNHFGGDCGLFNLASTAKDEIWTVENRDRYVDPESDVLAVSWVPPPPPDPERPDFGGRSIVPQRNHVYFESDEEEEGEFIQPPVRSRGPPSHRQQIRINGQAGGASTINGAGAGRQHESRNQRRNDGGPGGGGGRTSRNPPLPPGPPPSSLPARPMSGADSSRAGTAGGRRGRGGFSRVRGSHR